MEHATLEPARLVIPPIQDASEDFYAMVLLLVAERRGRITAWVGYKAVMN